MASPEESSIVEVREIMDVLAARPLVVLLKSQPATNLAIENDCRADF